MLEFIKYINHDYAGILSFLSSLIMVIITVIYVRHTRRQADYTKNSVELAYKQMIINKQPCIVPSVTNSHGTAFDATDNTRIQLGFDILLRNAGDALAINVYSLANIELQSAFDNEGGKKMLSADLLPSYVQALSEGEKKIITIHFETSAAF